MLPEIPYLTDPSGQEHLLEDETTRIGRDIENEIVIAAKLVSRDHAQVRREGRKTFIEDLGSTNGTFLNGERIQGVVSLHDGDQVSVGSVHFTFHDPDVTNVDTPIPQLDVNVSAGEVRINRKLIKLSPKEFALLTFLHENRGNVCSKDEIGRTVWAEYQEGIYDYQIENLVRRLRTKIETNPNAPQLLLTLRGLGYKLVLI